MILIDNSQVILSSIFGQIKGNADLIDESLVRHITLNSYRYFRNRFGDEYGELVICDDSSNCWRKDYFPHYKANRKKNQAKSGQDWSAIYDTLTTIRNEIIETFPYKNMRVERCEADDIIAILCKHMHMQEKIMIVSGDKDFKQLQMYPNVYQYSPIQRKMLDCSDPDSFLFEHIIKGDSSDGIPNVLSDDDVFIDENKRQKPCGAKKIGQLREDRENIESTRNWNRNKMLIDLTQIPEEMEDRIMQHWYYEPIVGSRSKILNYFVEHKLRNLMGDIQEF